MWARVWEHNRVAGPLVSPSGDRAGFDLPLRVSACCSAESKVIQEYVRGRIPGPRIFFLPQVPPFDVCFRFSLGVSRRVEVCFMRHATDFLIISVRHSEHEIFIAKKGSLGMPKGLRRGQSESLRGTMVGIDLFSGAGGMSLGASMAGVKILCAIEANPWAAKTYANNHQYTNVVAKRVEHIQRTDIPRIPRSSPLVVFGGPPCRGFSTSNQKTRSSRNPDNWLFRHYLRIVSALQPDWVVFENVTGILQTEGGRFLKEVVDRLEDMRYGTTIWTLNAADFGVPQRRSRLFVIAGRAGQVETPKGAHAPVTVADALSDLPSLLNGANIDCLPYASAPTSAYARRMRGVMRSSTNHLVTRNDPRIVRRYHFVPPGGNWRFIPKRLMRNYANRERCHEWIYHRLRSDQPSVVIGNYRKNMLIHPIQDRGLSVREAARLQSFPDWFEFTGSIGFQQQQVGNAVPPLLAKAVFNAVQKASGEPICQTG